MQPLLTQEFSSKSLSHLVEESIEAYLQELNTDDPQYLYRQVIKQVEYPLLKTMMKRTHYNQSWAAQLLGINRATLYRKLKCHGMI